MASAPVTTTTAHCLRCPWTAPQGDPAAVDKAAEKHTRTEKHGTATVTEAIR